MGDHEIVARIILLLANPFGSWTDLTVSERKVANLAAKGLKTREIAGELHKSQSAIDAAFRSIKQKTGLDKAGLVRVLYKMLARIVRPPKPQSMCPVHHSRTCGCERETK